MLKRILQMTKYMTKWFVGKQNVISVGFFWKGCSPHRKCCVAPALDQSQSWNRPNLSHCWQEQTPTTNTNLQTNKHFLHKNCQCLDQSAFPVRCHFLVFNYSFDVSLSFVPVCNMIADPGSIFWLIVFQWLPGDNLETMESILIRCSFCCCEPNLCLRSLADLPSDMSKGMQSADTTAHIGCASWNDFRSAKKAHYIHTNQYWHLIRRAW